ncbi:Serpin B9 [Manis pentadactyla]|nr:Serpin B9 [Manis pentadactyla]
MSMQSFSVNGMGLGRRATHTLCRAAWRSKGNPSKSRSLLPGAHVVGSARMTLVYRYKWEAREAIALAELPRLYDGRRSARDQLAGSPSSGRADEHCTKHSLNTTSRAPQDLEHCHYKTEAKATSNEKQYHHRIITWYKMPRGLKLTINMIFGSSII